MIKLRPHHLLCMQNFIGHGYDESFTRHMTITLENLQKHPETTIELVHSCDEICRHCPHNDHGTCTSGQKVQRMDNMVQKFFENGKPQQWETLCRIARDSILNTEQFTEICADCCWYTLCDNLLKGKK